MVVRVAPLVHGSGNAVTGSVTTPCQTVPLILYSNHQSGILVQQKLHVGPSVVMVRSRLCRAAAEGIFGNAETFGEYVEFFLGHTSLLLFTTTTFLVQIQSNEQSGTANVVTSGNVLPRFFALQPHFGGMGTTVPCQQFRLSAACTSQTYRFAQGLQLTDGTILQTVLLRCSSVELGSFVVVVASSTVARTCSSSSVHWNFW
mmetsp:Transcript_4716/g.7360  ORF Transcript_4716/g.7360 Transcript_4716/m.7360 type:complete len:202 (-) Transcript_4716:1016-1621(-)